MNVVIEYLRSHINDLINAFSTLVAAFIGAFFAFRLQNGSDKRKEIANRAASLNIFQVRIYHQYNNLVMIQTNFVSSTPKEKHGWINVPAFSIRDQIEHPDLSSISFLVDFGFGDTMPDILIAIEKYNEIIKAINARSTLHSNVLQPGIERVRKKNANNLTFELLMEEIGEKDINGIISYTQKINEILPGAIKFYEDLLSKIYKIGKSIYPKKKFLLLEDKIEQKTS